MVVGSIARGALSHLGGGPTLAAGFGFVILQLLLFALIWFTLRAQDTAATRAGADIQAATALQQLLRGVNETAVTEGASASRATATEAIALFEKQESLIDLASLSKASGIDWPALKARVGQYLAIRSVSAANIESMIALGKISAEASKLSTALEKSSAVSRADYAATQQNTRLLLASAAMLSLLGTGGIFFMFYRRVTLPLEGAVLVAERVASGDLTQRTQIGSSGEAASLMQALNAMQRNLAAIVSEVRITTSSVVDASSQLAIGNTDLSARTEQQASTLEETASSMEEFSSTVKHTSDSMRRADALAAAASKAAADGSFVASSAVAKIAEVNRSSKRISEIIGVIDGIAFQTNILALNAAVEAARAGEQGRGFAVVATEVRSLAQRSATAAKEIKALIAATQTHVEEGTTLVNRAGEAMDGVVDAIQQVTQIFSEISISSREQSVGIDQVAQAVTQLEEVTQQNAALVEESAAAAESMREQASVLAKLVSRFTLDDAGSGEVEKRVRRTAVLAQSRSSKAPSSARLTSESRMKAPAQPKDLEGEWKEF